MIRVVLLLGLVACGKKDIPTPLPLSSTGANSCTLEKTSCPQESINAYSDCIVSNCDGQYKACFGTSYMTGVFGDPCRPLIECAKGCANCDQACLQKCSDENYTGECKDCIEGQIASCVIDTLDKKKCNLPCVTVTTGCGGLETCCESLTKDSDKMSCVKSLADYKTIPGGADIQCDALLTSYKAVGKCTGINEQPMSALPGPLPSLCSMSGSVAMLQFVNNSTGSITAWWVDYNCEEQKYADIPAGQSFNQMTYTTHPWRLRDTTTRALLKEVAPATSTGTTVVNYP